MTFSEAMMNVNFAKWYCVKMKQNNMEWNKLLWVCAVKENGMWIRTTTYSNETKRYWNKKEMNWNKGNHILSEEYRRNICWECNVIIYLFYPLTIILSIKHIDVTPTLIRDFPEMNEGYKHHIYELEDPSGCGQQGAGTTAVQGEGWTKSTKSLSRHIQWNNSPLNKSHSSVRNLINRPLPYHWANFLSRQLIQK